MLTDGKIVVEILRDLSKWVASFTLSPFASVSLFFIAVIESIFFPIPPDVLLIPLAITKQDKALWFAFVCSLGSTIGGAIGYWLGSFSSSIFKKIVSSVYFERASSLYNKYNAWATAIGGFTPLPYKVFALSAGFLKVDFKTFFIATLISRSARFFLIGGSIFIWGEEIEFFIVNYLGEITFALVVVVALIYFLVVKFFSSDGKKSDYSG